MGMDLKRRAMLDELRLALDNNGMVTHCLNCDNHTKLTVVDENEMQPEIIACSLDTNAGQPPAKILIYGCSQWSVEIPF